MTAGERPDHLANTYLGDPEQYWRLYDANDTVRPDALVERLNAVVHIALPEGVTGVSGA